MKKIFARFLPLLLLVALLLTSCSGMFGPQDVQTNAPDRVTGTSAVTSAGTLPENSSFSLDQVPAYSDKASVAIHGNVPYFTANEIVSVSYETYGELDALGRCGVAVACVGKDLMPTENRGNISSIYPTGWIQAQYSFVGGGNLYNRCHLIAFQLTGENANRQNLITGTRYMNEAMIPYENMVADYIKETGNHVMYRVTPVFEGQNLLATGVLIEAWSVEDNGDGVCFCVWCYNVQPDVHINYADGSSHAADSAATNATIPDNVTYIINKKTGKFHLPTCSSVSAMSETNKEYFTGTREEAIAAGYQPCGSCKP